MPDARHFDPLLRRFGWAGGQPLTLSEAATLVGVSRERVRQIQDRVELDFHAQRVWTPVLDRAVNIIRRASPMPIQGVGPALNRAGITGRADFDAEGLLRADEIFHSDRRITRTSYQDWEFLVRSGETPDLGFFTRTRTAILKLLNHQGMTSLDALETQTGRVQYRRDDALQTIAMVDDWRLIDDQWIMPRDADSRNPLLNRIRKVLAIVPRCPLILLHIQLLREDRPERMLDLSIDALRAFVVYYPDLELLGNDVVASTRIPLPSEVLSESEQMILAALQAAGTDLSFANIVDAVKRASLSSMTAALTARTSPILQKRGRNIYALLSIDSGYPPPTDVSNVGETDVRDGHERLLAAEARGFEPVASAPGSVDGALQTVRTIALCLLRAEGCSNLTRLRNTLAAESNKTSKQNVWDAITTTDRFTMLDGEWFTTFEPELGNPLLEHCIQLRTQGLTVNEDTLRTRGVTVPGGPLTFFVTQWERECEQRVGHRVEQRGWDRIDAVTDVQPPAGEEFSLAPVPPESSIREAAPTAYSSNQTTWVSHESAADASALAPNALPLPQALPQPQPLLPRSEPLAASHDEEILEGARRIVERDGCGHRSTLDAILRGRKVGSDRATLDRVLDTTASITSLDSEWFTMLGAEIDNPLQSMVLEMEAGGLPLDAAGLASKGAVLPRRPLDLFLDAFRVARNGPQAGSEAIDPASKAADRFQTVTTVTTATPESIVSPVRPARPLVDSFTGGSKPDIIPNLGDEKHATIREVAHALIARRGCVPVSAVWDAFELDSANLDRNAFTRELHAIPEVVWLDSGWITSFAPTFTNGLMDQMRGRKTRIRGGDLRTLGAVIPVSIRELFISHYILWRQEKPEALGAGIVGQPRHFPLDRSAANASALEIAPEPELDHQPLIGDSPDDFPDGLVGNIQRTVTRYGVVQVEDLYTRFSGTRRAAIDAEIKQLVKAGYEWIDGSYLTIINPAYDNRLTTRLRRLLAVFANGCTVELACQQLGRNPGAFPRIAPSTLNSFVRKHPEFLLDGKLIRTNRKYPQNDPELFWDAELELQRIFAGSRKHVLSREEVLAAHDDTYASRENLEHHLVSSVLIRASHGDEKFELVTPSIASNYQVPLSGRKRRGAPKPQPTPIRGEPSTASDPGTAIMQTPRLLSPVLHAALPATSLTAPALSSSSSRPATASTPLRIGSAMIGHHPGAKPDTSPPSTSPHMTHSPAPLSAAPLRTREVPSTSNRHETASSLSIDLVPLRKLIEDLRGGVITVPEFQREYVWKSSQVCSLLDSLYRGYPVGGMLLWDTDEEVMIRTTGDMPRQGRPRERYLMDGQQRLTSLDRLMHPQSPGAAPTVLFDLVNEAFVPARAISQRIATNVDASLALRSTPADVLKHAGLETHAEREHFLSALARLGKCLDQPVPISTLKDFSFEEVVDVFSRVNSQGTRLKKVELLRADLAQRLPGLISLKIQTYEAQLSARGWRIEHQLLLHMLTAVTTGRGDENALARADTGEIEAGWLRTVEAVDAFLALLERYGIHSLDWIASRNALVTPVVYLASSNVTRKQPDLLMRWFFLVLAKQRYSDGVKAKVDQEVNIVASMGDDALPHLFGILRAAYGTLEISEEEIGTALDNGRLTLLMFGTMRHGGAVDLQTGRRLDATSVGDGPLLTHKIFPARTVGTRPSRALANTAFLLEPWTYDFPKLEFSGVPAERLRGQFVPLDLELWKFSNYKAFVAERQRLMAVAMNAFLDSLKD